MRSPAEVDADRTEAFDSAERTPATIVPVVLLAILVVAVTTIPAVERHFGLSTRAAALGNGAIVAAIAAATIAHRMAGGRSTVYRVLDRVETVTVQVALVGMARAAGGGAPVLWLLLLVHTLVAGHSGIHARLLWLTTVALPTIVGLHAAATSEPLPAVQALATALAGSFVISIGEGFARRLSELSAERERLAATITTLEVEKERRRIARDLHDGIAGDLSSFAVRLEELRKGVSDEDLRKGLDVLHGRTTGSIDELRSIVWALRAPDRSFEELASYAEQRCRELCPASVDLVFHVDAPDPGASPISGGLCLSVVRILQELVRNACRHAAPTSVRVSLRRGSDLEIVVENKGGSLPSSSLEKALAGEEGGLSNIRQRARELSGHVELDTSSARLRVKVTLPLAGDAVGD